MRESGVETVFQTGDERGAQHECAGVSVEKFGVATQRIRNVGKVCAQRWDAVEEKSSVCFAQEVVCAQAAGEIGFAWCTVRAGYSVGCNGATPHVCVVCAHATESKVYFTGFSSHEKSQEKCSNQI